MPFASPNERADHFRRHGTDFGAQNEIDYEAMAERFLLGPKSATCLDYTRGMGDLVRFDLATDEFGVLGAMGEIRTYFKPVPGVTHRRATNLLYFRATCKRY